MWKKIGLAAAQVVAFVLLLAVIFYVGRKTATTTEAVATTSAPAKPEKISATAPAETGSARTESSATSESVTATATPGHIQSMRALDSIVESGKSGNSGELALQATDEFGGRKVKTAIDVRVGAAATQHAKDVGQMNREVFLSKLPADRAELLVGVNGLSQARTERDRAIEKLSRLEEQIKTAQTTASAKERAELIRTRNAAANELATLKAKPPKVMTVVKTVDRPVPVAVVRTVDRPVDRVVYRDRVVYKKYDCRTGSYYDSPTP